MKFTTKTVTASKEILANDHFVALQYNCSALTALATNNVIKAGTIIPSNDSAALGVLLYDVNLNENPNAAVVVHGFIDVDKLDTKPTTAAITALASRGVQFVLGDAKILPTSYTVTYNANGGTGTVTDASSPYTYGTTVTVKDSTGLTAPSNKQFSGWALVADATAKNDDYDAADTFVIRSNITLYAVWTDTI